MSKSIRTLLTGLVIIVALAMILSLSACSSNQNHAETKSLYAQGLDVVGLMSEMAGTNGYADIYTGNSEIKTVIQNIASGDYSAPQTVYASF